MWLWMLFNMQEKKNLKSIKEKEKHIFQLTIVGCGMLLVIIWVIMQILHQRTRINSGLSKKVFTVAREGLNTKPSSASRRLQRSDALGDDRTGLVDGLSFVGGAEKPRFISAWWEIDAAGETGMKKATRRWGSRRASTSAG